MLVHAVHHCATLGLHPALCHKVQLCVHIHSFHLSVIVIISREAVIPWKTKDKNVHNVLLCCCFYYWSWQRERRWRVLTEKSCCICWIYRLLPYNCCCCYDPYLLCTNTNNCLVTMIEFNYHSNSIISDRNSDLTDLTAITSDVVLMKQSLGFCFTATQKSYMKYCDFNSRYHFYLFN